MTPEESLPTFSTPALAEPLGDRGQAAPEAPPPRSLSGQLVRFLVVGLTNTAVGLAVFAVANHLGVWYPVASAAAFVAGALNGYTLNRIWTFRAGAFSRRSFARYMIVQVVSLVTNELVIVALVDGLRLEHIGSQVISLIFASCVTFGLNRQWAFASAPR